MKLYKAYLDGADLESRLFFYLAEQRTEFRVEDWRGWLAEEENLTMEERDSLLTIAGRLLIYSEVEAMAHYCRSVSLPGDFHAKAVKPPFGRALLQDEELTLALSVALEIDYIWFIPLWEGRDYSLDIKIGGFVTPENEHYLEEANNSVFLAKLWAADTLDDLLED